MQCYHKKAIGNVKSLQPLCFHKYLKVCTRRVSIHILFCMEVILEVKKKKKKDVGRNCAASLAQVTTA